MKRLHLSIFSAFTIVCSFNVQLSPTFASLLSLDTLQLRQIQFFCNENEYNLFYGTWGYTLEFVIRKSVRWWRMWKAFPKMWVYFCNTQKQKKIYRLSSFFKKLPSDTEKHASLFWSQEYEPIRSENQSTIQKKSLAQKLRRKVIFPTVEVRVTPTLFPTQLLGHCAICKGPSYTKNKYNLFYQKLDAEYFFIQQFFRKKQYFPIKLKICFGGTFNNFLGKGGVLRQKLTQLLSSQMRYWIFYYLTVFFFKEAVFSEKTAKNRFWAPSLFWREWGARRWKWI